MRQQESYWTKIVKPNKNKMKIFFNRFIDEIFAILPIVQMCDNLKLDKQESDSFIADFMQGRLFDKNFRRYLKGAGGKHEKNRR